MNFTRINLLKAVVNSELLLINLREMIAVPGWSESELSLLHMMEGSALGIHSNVLMSVALCSPPLTPDEVDLMAEQVGVKLKQQEKSGDKVPS